MTLTPAAARGQPLAWLLTIQVGGRVYRFSEVEGNPNDSETGTDLHYVGALVSVEPPTIEVADGGNPPTASASVEWLHPTEAGWAGIVDADPDVHDATAELALWVVGDDWQRRHVVISGNLDVTSYRGAHEPVAATISLRTTEDTSRIPAPELVCNTTRWPAVSDYILPEGSYDVPYPIVVGTPGYPGSDLAAHRGWPVVVVKLDNSDRSNVTNVARVLIHGDTAAVAGSTVKLYNLTSEVSATVSVTSSIDSAGQPVAIADVAGATLAIDEGDELWCSAASTTPVGIMGTDLRTGGVSGVGDFARWLLSRSTLDVDFGAMEGDLERLNLYKVSTVLNEPRSASDILADLLDLLPCGWYAAPRGLALRVWPSDEEPHVATVGPLTGCAIASMIEPSPGSDVRDAWRISYDPDRADSANRRTMMILPNPDPADTNQIPSLYAMNANARGGLPPTTYRLRWADPIEADWVNDQGTAFQLMEARARRESRIRYRVTYDCPPEFQFITGGSVVKWVDEEFLRDCRARVVGITYGLERCALTLETL